MNASSKKIFHCEIVVDNARVVSETKAYQKIPEIISFTDENGNDTMQANIDRNYKQISGCGEYCKVGNGMD